MTSFYGETRNLVRLFLSKDSNKPDFLINSLKDADVAHAILGLRQQFPSAFWWLLGHTLIVGDKQKTQEVEQMWSKFVDRFWINPAAYFHWSSIEILSLLLTDFHVSKPILQTADLVGIKMKILNSLLPYPREWLQLVVDEPVLTINQPLYHFNLSGDDTHMDARLVYSSLLCLILAQRGHQANLPSIMEMRTTIKELLTPPQINGLVQLLKYCYCPVQKCFTGTPRGEPHAGYNFCVAASMAILCPGWESDPEVKDFMVTTATWQYSRLPHDKDDANDAFKSFHSYDLCCGRPGKSGDVCYCFWVLATLRILNVEVDENLKGRITAGLRKCEKEEQGIYSKNPSEVADLFHSFFGSLAARLMNNDKSVNCYFGAPIFIMPS